MNEQAINLSYQLFVNAGYGGSIEDFGSLLKTNQKALQDSNGLFTQA